MTRTTPIAIAAALLALLVAPSALADDEAEVGSCLRLIAQEKAPEGKRMVSMDHKGVMLMQEAVYSFTLFKGLDYEIRTCAAANVTDLDLHLYDQDGKLVQAETAVDREPSISIKPDKTGTYYLVLKMLDTNNAQPGHVGYIRLYE